MSGQICPTLLLFHPTVSWVIHRNLYKLHCAKYWRYWYSTNFWAENNEKKRNAARYGSFFYLFLKFFFGTMPKISFVRSFTSFNENSTANTQLAYDFLLHRRKLMMSIYHQLRASALYNFHSSELPTRNSTVAHWCKISIFV